MRGRQSRLRETVGDRAPLGGQGPARARRPRKAVRQCREAQRGSIFSQDSREVYAGATDPGTPTFRTSRADRRNPWGIFADV